MSLSRTWIPVVTGMSLLLASCGFQLRGDPAVGMKTLFIPGGGVAQEIRRTLASGPTRVVNQATEAEAHLRILAEVREKNIHTITGTGRVYEFELRLVVRYDMRVPGSEVPVIAPAEVAARRIITYSEAAPIAKEAEELLLFKDMQLEVADRILRQVAVARREM
ncbi:MAG TPA: LPS assembly lipoprotein LptE [Usitatibacter sp.]|nr:LPS assembly lipoprotein LptE [Usitatibacter sp.]